jgi:hypothetical protein
MAHPSGLGVSLALWGGVRLRGAQYLRIALLRVPGLGRCLVRLYPKLHFVCLAFIHLAHII